jgi:cephalosporin hydroxylase
MLTRSNNGGSLRSAVAALLPHGIVTWIRSRRPELPRQDRTTLANPPICKSDIRNGGDLLTGYCSGLTAGERLALLAMLHTLLRKHEQVRYLEIGVCGGGTIKFLKQQTNGRMHFSGVDPFESFETDDGNTHISGVFTLADVQRSLGDDVALTRGYSETVIPQLKREGKQYEAIFIDANHTYEATKQDFELALPLLAPGGWVAFHNATVQLKPDPKYIARDGGPWEFTQQLRRSEEWFLEIEVERVRIFSRT